MHEELDYFDVIFRGYFDFEIPYLDKYLCREFKAIEKYGYDSDEFFRGCLRVINSLENNDFDDNDRIALYSRMLNPNLLRYPLIRELGESDFDNIRVAIGRASGEMNKSRLMTVKDGLVFSNFFNSEIENGKIEKVAEIFKNEKGQKIACLISILQENGIIELIYNSKERGRAPFVRSLNPELKMQSIDKCFESNKDRLSLMEESDVYISTLGKLSNIIEI